MVKTACAAFLVLATAGTGAMAQQASEEYTAGIWVDPDGCQHYVMDDGVEGYMTPRRNRDGSAVCGPVVTCGDVASDALFATDSSAISSSVRAELTSFFQSGVAQSYGIIGHTDQRASLAYNQALSERRANAVAGVARAAGATVASVTGQGETQPKVAGTSRQAYAANRRVEIICVK